MRVFSEQQNVRNRNKGKETKGRFPKHICLCLSRLSYWDSCEHLLNRVGRDGATTIWKASCVWACICRSLWGFFSVTICVLIHGENVECKRLPVSSTIGLDMLCRLFFLSFCSPLTKIDFWNTFRQDKRNIFHQQRSLCCVFYRAILH